MLVRAADRRVRGDRMFQAAMVANLLNSQPGRRRPVTIAQLLGEEREKKSRAQLLKDAKKRGRTYADYLEEHGLTPKG